MKVLVIDDAPDVVEVISLVFELRWPGTTVISAGNGAKGIEMLRAESPDLVILDVGLPGMDGFQVLKEIRSFSQTPVIMLTVRDADTDVARALETGADDYVTKPFSHIELLARVHSVLRRTLLAASPTTEKPFVSGDLKIDFAARDVWSKGQRIKLTPTEFGILSLLARNAGKVVPYKDLLTTVWGPEYADATNYLKVHIQRLRRKLDDDPQEPKLILTEWKVGYKLVAIPPATPSEKPLERPRAEGTP